VVAGSSFNQCSIQEGLKKVMNSWSMPSTRFFFNSQCRPREKKSKCFESAIGLVSWSPPPHKWSQQPRLKGSARVEFDQETRQNSKDVSPNRFHG
jgi:hypothetical protein